MVYTDEKFGNQVRKIRKTHNISQEKLAYLADIDRSHMGHIERGTTSPTLKMINKIATVLKVSPKDLME